MGFTKFQTPCSTSRKSPTRRSWTRRSAGSHPLWRIPYEAFPSSVAWNHAVTASRPFGRDRVHRLVCLLAVRAVPAPVSPRRAALLVDLKALLHRGVRCVARDVAAARPLDAPLGFGSNTFRCCRAFRAAQLCWTFRLAVRTASASLDPNVERRQGVSALSGSRRCTALRSPKGWPRVIAVAPASPEGGTSAALHHA
jgi:hypothetical protein